MSLLKHILEPSELFHCPKAKYTVPSETCDIIQKSRVQTLLTLKIPVDPLKFKIDFYLEYRLNNLRQRRVFPFPFHPLPEAWHMPEPEIKRSIWECGQGEARGQELFWQNDARRGPI